MGGPAIPLAILGGSDLRPGLAPSGSGRLLTGYKAVDLQLEGRPLLLHLVERFRACGAFDPISVAGPARVYAGLDPGLRLIDTDADVGTNVRAVVDDFLAHHERGALAVVTCDVLPSVAELEGLMGEYRAGRPCDLWFPLVRAPRDPRELGAFGWKPEYGLVPEPGRPAVRILPGHLVIADPRALRLDLFYRLTHAAYRTRNRPVRARQGSMLRSVLLGLLLQDLRHLFALRPPVLTWTVLRNGLALARELRAGGQTRAEFERRVGRIVLSARHRRAHPERGVRMPIVEAIGMAADIDTDEEARAIGARPAPAAGAE